MKKLYICSVGLDWDDLSLKVIKIISQSDILVSNFYSENELKKLKPDGYRFINNGSSDTDLIKQIEKLFYNYKTVVYLTRGNPLFLNIVSLNIYSYFRKKRIKVEVIPAVSSFDYVINMVMKKFKIRVFEFSVFFYPMNMLKHNSCDFKNSLIFNLDAFNKIDGSYREEFIKFVFKSFNKSRNLYLIAYDFLKSKEYVKKAKIKDIRKIIRDIGPNTTVFIP